MALTVTAAETAAIAAAKDAPTLIANLSAVDSPLVQQLNGKGLLFSKTAWGAVLVPLLTVGGAKYFGWSADTTLDVLGALMAVGGIVARLATKAPISALVSAPPVAAVKP